MLFLQKMFYGFHRCPQFKQTLNIFLLVKPPITAPTAAPGAFSIAPPIAVPTAPLEALSFLFVFVILLLPHLGHEGIPLRLLILYCFFGDKVTGKRYLLRLNVNNNLVIREI